MFTFEEDTTLEDVTESTAMVTLLGPLAEAAMAHLLGIAAAPEALGSRNAVWQGREALVLRRDWAGHPGFDIVMRAEGAEALWDAALGLGATPVGRQALEALRIEARVPRWGAEFTEDNNPLEAGLLGEVCWTKGCYTGQEVVARLYNYHRIQRFMVALELPAEAEIPAGAVLMAEGASVGRVTSASPIAHDGAQAALASIRSGHAGVGTRLHVGESGPPVWITWAPEEAQQGAAA